MKRWKEDIKGLGGIEYITFKKVPMRDSEWGPIVEINESILENIAAISIIELGIPLRGKEVKFLRKCLGLSLSDFAKLLSLTAASILKWERAEDTRLHPINEVAVRAIMAEQLKLEISGKYSDLKGNEKTPKMISLKVA